MVMVNQKQIRDDIEHNGYSIAKNAIDKKFISNQRTRWLNYFKNNPKTKNFVRGSLFLGEENFCSYSQIPAWCMYRYFEFLWNKNSDSDALNVHLDIHRKRNQIQGFESNDGLEYNDEGYGIYISTSLYQPEKGMLEAHRDGHGDKLILHYMLPLTFKGDDYSGGGLHIRDKNDQVIDVDQLVSPGDLIFFDGRCEHWVQKITSNNTNMPGRLAVFAIPTHFNNDAFLGTKKRSMFIRFYEIYSIVRNIISPKKLADK